MLTAADRHDVHRSGEGHAARLRLQCGVTRAELAVRAVAAGVGFTAAQQEGRVPPAARGLHHTLLHQPRLQPGGAYRLALVRQAALAVLRRAGAVGEALGVLGPLGSGQWCGLGRPGLLGSWRGEGCRHCLGAGVERDRRCPRFRFEFEKFGMEGAKQRALACGVVSSFFNVNKDLNHCLSRRYSILHKYVTGHTHARLNA